MEIIYKAGALWLSITSALVVGVGWLHRQVASLNSGKNEHSRRLGELEADLKHHGERQRDLELEVAAFKADMQTTKESALRTENKIDRALIGR